MTSKEFITLLELLKKRSPSIHVPIEEARANFEKFLSAFPPDPEVAFKFFSIAAIPACWVLAPDVKEDRVILFLHGGGFNAGSIQSHRDLMGRISRAADSAVLAIDYRLAPEYPFPAALEDALYSYKWLLRQSFKEIFFVGSSAGGGLALSLCLKLKKECILQPTAVACICPMVDLTFGSDSITRNKDKDWVSLEKLVSSAKDYCHNQDITNPLISPLFGEFRGLSNLLIQVGSYEVLRDEAIAMAEKAKMSGVSVALEEWPEMIHCWHLFASKIPEGRQAIDRIGDFFKAF